MSEKIERVIDCTNCPFVNCSMRGTEKCIDTCIDYVQMIHHAASANMSSYRFNPNHNKLTSEDFRSEESEEKFKELKNNIVDRLITSPIMIINSNRLEARLRGCYQIMMTYMGMTRERVLSGDKRRFYIVEWDGVKDDLTYEDKQELKRVEFLFIQYNESDSDLVSLVFHRREWRKPTIITNTIDFKTSDDLLGLVTSKDNCIVL